MKPTFIQKYKCTTFKDIKQNDIIIQLYNKLIQNKNLSILIVGNMSTGKTTHIEVLVNEYFKQFNISNMDDYILKINHLNEHGIQYSRNRLKTFCQTKSFIKKIIIIDDLDLINEQNQQIIRGNINQYSDNVHFICSCSNIKKINETLQSRLLIVYINPIKIIDLKNLYQKVKKIENIEIEDHLQEQIIKQCNYHSKTMLNLLELFSLYNNPITMDNYLELCNSIPYTYFTEYIQYCKEKDSKKAIDYLNQLINKGFSVIDILQKFILFLKHEDDILLKHKYEMIKIISKFICIFYTIHEQKNELIIFTKNIINIF